VRTALMQHQRGPTRGPFDPIWFGVRSRL